MPDARRQATLARGVPIVAQYYNFLRLGQEGYRRVHQASYEIGLR
jgi:glutamate/tyrosine decarboxylase-like PLP-dependent enzyme